MGVKQIWGDLKKMKRKKKKKTVVLVQYDEAILSYGPQRKGGYK